MTPKDALSIIKPYLPLFRESAIMEAWQTLEDMVLADLKRHDIIVDLLNGLNDINILCEKAVAVGKAKPCPHTHVDFPKVGTEHIKVCRDCGAYVEDTASEI